MVTVYFIMWYVIMLKQDKTGFTGLELGCAGLYVLDATGLYEQENFCLSKNTWAWNSHRNFGVEHSSSRVLLREIFTHKFE